LEHEVYIPKLRKLFDRDPHKYVSSYVLSHLFTAIRFFKDKDANLTPQQQKSLTIIESEFLPHFNALDRSTTEFYISFLISPQKVLTERLKNSNDCNMVVGNLSREANLPDSYWVNNSRGKILGCCVVVSMLKDLPPEFKKISRDLVKLFFRDLKDWKSKSIVMEGSTYETLEFISRTFQRDAANFEYLKNWMDDGNFKLLNEINYEVSLGKAPKPLLHQCIRFIAKEPHVFGKKLQNLPSELREFVNTATTHNQYHGSKPLCC